MVRVGCENQATTNSRLQTIVQSLFPKGQKVVCPKDAPYGSFVRIIHCIGMKRLDFAFKEIINDLLCVNRTMRAIQAERMAIGLRALIAICDSLEQKEGPPAMPRNRCKGNV